MSFILIRHIGTTEAEINKLTLRRNDKAANSGRCFGGRKGKKQAVWKCQGGSRIRVKKTRNRKMN